MHSLCYTDVGELYAWGSNKEGQLGIPISDLGKDFFFSFFLFLFGSLYFYLFLLYSFNYSFILLFV